MTPIKGLFFVWWSDKGNKNAGGSQVSEEEKYWSKFLFDLRRKETFDTIFPRKRKIAPRCEPEGTPRCDL